MAQSPGGNALQPRSADGRFGEVARDEADGVSLDAHPSTEDALMVRVQPQVWVNDYAVDSGPSVAFDASPVLRTMTEDDRERVLTALRDGDGSDVLDDLYLDCAERGLVEPGYGPFYVVADGTEEDIDAWDAATPYEDPRLTPADTATKTLFADLKPGDVFLVEQYSEGDPVYVEVTVLGEPGETKDIFGRSMQSLPCRRADTGAEGGYMYGPEGFTRKARICERHGGAWGNDRTCTDCTEPDGATRPLPEETR